MVNQDRVRSWSAEFFAVLVLVSLAAMTTIAFAQTNNDCDQPGEAPDIVIEDLYQTQRWGRVGDITAFSIGTYACNLGTCWAVWFPNNNQHPVISGNMFRLKDGKFEQIGQCWLKHGFFALSTDFCSSDCIPTDGTHMGVNCADPYSAGLNGEQDRLGPKFEVNPATGDFPYPATDLYLEGDAIYKRLQVHNVDLNPDLNPGAQYFIESQYITPDEPAGGTNLNNSSYRPVNVTGVDPTYNLALTAGPTVPELPAIMAWVDSDPEVDLNVIGVPDDGLIYLAARATDLGGGRWGYEYAIQNVNSDRAVGKFHMPILPNADLQNIGFHDVDYHSGEPFDGADWRGRVETGAIPYTLIWETDAYSVNPDANALRWDTLYNFRFDADLPPRTQQATLGLFRPGDPTEISVMTVIPRLCNFNGTCDLGEDICDCPGDCVPAVAETLCTDSLDDDCDGDVDCYDLDCCAGSDCDNFDIDEDGVGICDDCTEDDKSVWGTPGEVQNVRWQEIFGGQLVLAWDAPAELGGYSVNYETLRSEDASDFVTDPTCLVGVPPTVLWYLDSEVPASGVVYHYLPRARNACPGTLGMGSVGAGSDDIPRPAARCD
jgi:hypothetical protein